MTPAKKPKPEPDDPDDHGQRIEIDGKNKKVTMNLSGMAGSIAIVFFSVAALVCTVAALIYLLVALAKQTGFTFGSALEISIGIVGWCLSVFLVQSHQ